MEMFCRVCLSKDASVFHSLADQPARDLLFECTFVWVSILRLIFHPAVSNSFFLLLTRSSRKMDIHSRYADSAEIGERNEAKETPTEKGPSGVDIALKPFEAYLN